MPATSKQSLIVTGKPSRGRATRASELAAARQADAASLQSCSRPDRGAPWRQESKNKEVQPGKFPAKQRRVHIGGGIEQMRHSWFAQSGLAIWRFSRK
jgi:hypothetical protein